jgi:two-component system, response regulator / RNA-binding antiterminator
VRSDPSNAQESPADAVAWSLPRVEDALQELNMLRVMVVDDDKEREQVLRLGLEQAGYEVVARLEPGVDLSREVEKTLPDVIIIDLHSPDRDTLEHVIVISQDQPRPIVMFSADGDSAKIRDAVSAGVSAYIVNGLSAERIDPIIQVAIARFQALQSLREELADAQTQLADRKRIERAKGILMQQKNMSEDEAYRALRKLAMDRNLKLAEVAEQLINVHKLLS